MNVLLVEDNPEVTLITVEYLNELGHQVLAVSSAEAAIESVSRSHFDAVMTDVSLPGMSGIDLAKEVSKRLPALPVIICSGYGTLNVEALFGERQRGILILPKPYDMVALEKTLAVAAGLATS